MKISVIILNWNGAQHLRTFLPSVIETTPEGVAIIVADNGSNDNSIEVLENEFPDVGIIRLDKNYGFAEGYNRALAEIESDFYILLNSDIKPRSGWVKPLVEALDGDTKLVAVAPKILSYTDPTKFEYAGASGGFIDALGYPFCRGRIMNYIEEDRGQYDTTRPVFWATGAAMAVRRELFTEVGGFDIRFFAHQEEIDLCWRAQLYGWHIAVEPRSVVEHLGGGTLNTTSPFKTYLNFRNNLAMIYKNLPRRRQWKVSFRMFLDGFSAVVYLLSGHKALYKEVLRAHRDFRALKPALRISRAEIRSRTIAHPTGVYKGSILLRYAFGKRRFPKVMEPKH